PDVLILDEPTSGLDPVMQEVFVSFIKEEKQRGKTILLSSHIFSEVDATCDRIAIIKDGRLVDTFVADDLKHASQKRYMLSLQDETAYERFIKQAKELQAKANAILTLEEANCNAERKTAVFVTDDKYINAVSALLAEYAVTDFRHLKETLEDYFMRYYKEDKDFGGALQ
ncbi:MAG: ABC transporter ATP-binding protein, partial [Clostridiales bacterium]|nr:ABC transporter ATP-binding protein [Clostridiales bacterium]